MGKPFLQIAGRMMFVNRDEFWVEILGLSLEKIDV